MFCSRANIDFKREPRLKANSDDPTWLQLMSMEHFIKQLNCGCLWLAMYELTQRFVKVH